MFPKKYLLKITACFYLCCSLFLASASAVQITTAPVSKCSVGLKLFPVKGDEPFKFVVCGDNRPDFNDPLGKQPEAWREIIEEANKLKPSFLVNTGDLIVGYTDKEEMVRKEFNIFLKTVEELEVPLFIAPGNHDLQPEAIYRLYREMICPETYFSFNFGNSHFVFLSADEPGYEHRIGDEQKAWLRKVLEENKDKEHIFVFVHQPLYPSLDPKKYPYQGHKGSSLDVYPAQRDELAGLFSQYKVDMVFHGHEHCYDKSLHNGVPYIITGGAGAPLHRGSDSSNPFYHYVVVSVNGKEVKTQVIRVELGNK